MKEHILFRKLIERKESEANYYNLKISVYSLINKEQKYGTQ